MMKLNTKIHGIVDYLVVLFLWVSPIIFNLPEITSLFTYILGGIHLVLTSLTDFEVGVFKVVPVKIHGWVELVVSLALVGVALYLGQIEGDLARNFYFAFAGAVFLTWLVTDYRLEEGTN